MLQPKSTLHGIVLEGVPDNSHISAGLGVRGGDYFLAPRLLDHADVVLVPTLHALHLIRAQEVRVLGLGHGGRWYAGLAAQNHLGLVHSVVAVTRDVHSAAKKHSPGSNQKRIRQQQHPIPAPSQRVLSHGVRGHAC